MQLDDRLLQAVVEGVEAAVGEEFFRSLVSALARALSASHVFVSELAPGGGQFVTRAFCKRGELTKNVTVPIPGSPCQGVLDGSSAFYPARLQELYPEDVGLTYWKSQSYGGVPLFSVSGRVVGHLAFFHDAPLTELDGERALAVMRIFAKRAVAEIDRLAAEQRVHESEARLRSIVENASDGILTFDESGVLLVVNEAAARMLRCPVSQALGSKVGRFTSEKDRATFVAMIERLREHGATPLAFEERDDFHGLRADGAPVALAGSLFRSDSEGRVRFTLVARDLEERRAAELQLTSLRRETEYLREEIASVHGFADIVGKSDPLRRVLDELALVAATESTVLVTGETGTGKELIARAIHARSRRAEKPLVKVNCAAIPSGLVESELFGHERGAFTGATQRRIGRFELAHGGSIFLDEVGELPLDVQAKLLRVLQERELERVGGERPIRVDVRVIAATNRDLPARVAEGQFRSDLFYRLNVFPLHVPPLRERAEDIALLAHFFVQRHAAGIGRAAASLSPRALEFMRRYAWPGNVRELENVVERALILAPANARELEIPDALLPAEALAPAAKAAPAAAKRDAEPSQAPEANSLEEKTRQHIVRVLEQCSWRIEGEAGAAKLLGMNSSTLRSRMQKLGIRRGGN